MTAISPEEKQIITEETEILSGVLESLQKQKVHYQGRSQIESARARELTSKIVATRRDEEKAMLASDEAVSHALEARNLSEIKTLSNLLKRPYFARIVLEEERNNGEIKEIEYKIGFSANPDCRIIDWRKAPISKLFYEYKEGDEYSEEIQGIERTGKIKMRNTLEIEDADLKRINCRLGSFEKKDDQWVKTAGAAGSHKNEYRGELPDVLSLITPEQFHAITEDATTAVLIQGVAGSGKTTVALYRLSWLLSPDNSDLKPEGCLILVITNSLKTYIQNSLRSLDIEGVRVLTLNEWHTEVIRNAAPVFVDENGNVTRPDERCPAGIERTVRSMALLNCMEEHLERHGSEKSFRDLILDILARPDELIRHDETRLLDRELIEKTRLRCTLLWQMNMLDYCMDALLIRHFELVNSHIYLKDGNAGHYKHIIVDEVQDLGPSDIACVIGAVKDIKDLTLVGDVSQRIDPAGTFPGWDRLRRYWDHKDSVSKYLTLTVSHRSTLPIMRLADHIQGRQLVNDGRPGRVPIWFRAVRESKGLESAINWLTTALQRYPQSLTAVVCRDEQEAKYAQSLLRPTFGAICRIGDSYSFSFEAGILVTDIRQIKGLEFRNVLIWNPSEKSYPSSDPVSKNLLYVAITRAEENLCIVTWSKPASALPDFRSPLIRGYRVGADEEE